MFNPIFKFVSQNPNVLKNLSNEFNVVAETKTFKQSDEKYFLLTLPLSIKKELNLSDQKLKVEDHHFTIPAVFDEKTQSCYHYSLVLINPKTKQQFKIHLFFDKLDRISVEPKLYSYENEGNPAKFIKLNNKDMANVVDFFSSYTTVILQLREHLKLKLTALNEKRTVNEAKLEDLSKDLKGNFVEYLRLVKNQIDILRSLENFGEPQYAPERKYYQRLGKRPITSFAANAPVNDEKKEMHPSEEKKMVDTKEEPEKQSSKKRRRKIKASKAKAATISVINKCQNLTSQIEVASQANAVDEGLIKKLIMMASECNAQICLEQDSSKRDVLIKYRLFFASRVSRYFDEKNIIEHPEAFILAVNANLCLMNDKLIEHIIENDNVELLQQLLDANLVSESARYRLCGMPYGLTIVECCAHLKSVKCFRSLLNGGFSLNYFDQEHSPFYDLAADLDSLDIILSPLITNVDRTVKTRFYNRMISLLEIKCQKAVGDELILLQLRIRLYRGSAKFLEFLDKNPSYKAMWGLGKYCSAVRTFQKSEAIDSKMKEQINTSIVLQESKCERSDAVLNLIILITPNFKTLLKPKDEIFNQHSANPVCTKPIESIIEKVVQSNKLDTLAFNLYARIISSGEALRYEEQRGFIFKSDSKIARYYQQELKKLSDLFCASLERKETFANDKPSALKNDTDKNLAIAFNALSLLDTPNTTTQTLEVLTPPLIYSQTGLKAQNSSATPPAILIQESLGKPPSKNRI